MKMESLSMTKCKALVFLLLLLALPLSADNRKKKVAQHSPDSVPASLSVERVPSADVEASVDSVVVRYVDAPLPQWGRYNLNTVAPADPDSWKGRLRQKLDSLTNTVMFETSQLGFYVYDITADEDLYAVNYLQRMRPASCEKLVTAITALHCLGGDYRLFTDLRATGSVSNGVLEGGLYVVGRMDPLLARADVVAMARELRAQGISGISGPLYIDTSFKDDDEYGWGWCWDDKWGPLRVLTVDGKDNFAQAFLSALSSAGISVAQPSFTGAVCPSSARLLAQVSHTIDQILLTMMKESNNIFAESLFYHIAALSGERGAGRKQAAAFVSGFISSCLGLDASAYQIADGSGLSLYNYVSPQLLVNMLSYAWRDENIRPHLYYSLPIAGSDGTLSRRMKGTAADHNVHAKTGTVEGISSLSGYTTNREGHTIAFSIINQGISPGSLGRAFQDKVCQLLCQ